jgi:hypothetical protein
LIIACFTAGDEERPMAIGNLFFSRRSSSKQWIHTARWLCFALGSKSMR